MDVTSPAGGGKFKQFVKDIINAERKPVHVLEARKAKESEKLKLIQDFSGKVKKVSDTFKDLSTFNNFRELKATVAEPNLLDVSVNKESAETGEYDIEILQLAGRHSMISNGYSSPEDEVGVGYFMYDTPDGESVTVWLGPGNNTLQDLVKEINRCRSLGIQASLVNDGSGTESETPWRIVVQSRKSGLDNDVTYPDFYFLDGDFRFVSDDERGAQNAIIRFNGFEMMSQSNRFELLSGVTLDLKHAEEGKEFTFTITEDIGKVSDKVKGLVDSLNTVLEFINTQNKLDAQSDTSRTLGGDTALTTIESRVRRLIFEPYDITNLDECALETDEEQRFYQLSDVGIRFEKTGQLSFNQDVFKKALSSNFERVAGIFAGQGNFIDRLKYIVNGFLTPDTGPVNAREQGIRKRIRAIDEDIARKEDALGKRETQLKRQFAQLEGLMGNMQSQQAYLQQSLGSPSLIPGAPS